MNRSTFPTLPSLIFFVAFLMPCFHAARILMLPISVNSHVVYFSQLAAGLVDEGHQITLVVANNSRVPDFVHKHKDITLFKYKSEDVQFVISKNMSAVMFKVALADGILEKLKVQLSTDRDDIMLHWATDAEGLINDTALVNKLMTSKFDFAILDPVYPPYFYAFVHKLALPYASFSIPYSAALFRVPHFSSFIPNSFLSTSSDKMDFKTRLQNYLLDILEYAMVCSMYEKDYMSKVAPEKDYVSTSTLVQKSTLWFYLYDPVLACPRPLMPNTVFLGDIMARPSKPLPTELEKLLSYANNGAILVSFGSMMEAMPEKYSRMFFEVFGQLGQTVIMKKAGFIPEKIPENVKLIRWLPQNDLLGHPNVKLFISHCGLNSLIEAVYHGKPVLGIPIAMDQPYNAFVVEDKGYGKVLQFGKLSVAELKENIEEILNNKSFTDIAKKMSVMFRDKPHKAAVRASHMINHVLKHGDHHLRTRAFSLNFLQFYMWDIYIFLLTVLIVLCVLSFYLCKYFCVCFWKCKYGKMKKQKTT